jgi:hypothetical protein
VRVKVVVAATVQHAHHIDAVVDRRVEDEVPPERKTPQISGQFFPRPAGDTWHRRHEGLRELAHAPGMSFALGILGAPRLAGATLQAEADVVAQLLELGSAQPVLFEITQATRDALQAWTAPTMERTRCEGRKLP